MAKPASPGRNGFVARHPVVVFLVALLQFSLLFQLFWAGLAGGWARWGDGILWYRASCVGNDLALAGWAYLCTRILAGPLWWREKYILTWTSFFAICAAGAIFLMILSRHLARLYGNDAPPMTTGWLPVWQRAFVPLLLLLWVRRRFFYGLAYLRPTQT